MSDIPIYDIGYNDTTNYNFTYPNVKLLKPINGINYFDGRWTKMQSVNISEQSETGSYEQEIFNFDQNNFRLFHVHGTITRDITDNTAFYYFADLQSNNYAIAMQNPTNPYNSETTVDFILSTPRANISNVFKLLIYPCNEKQEIIQSPCNINLTVDCYCL